VDQILAWVEHMGLAERTYWVCAFSVSQHDGICSGNPNKDCDSVTGIVHATCDCGKEKQLNTTPPLYKGKSAGCEMNNFDNMMEQLFMMNSAFTQVIAVDPDFILFTRAWCVSEIAKAHRLGMKQNLKVFDIETLDCHEDALRNLRVEEMSATRPEDIREILDSIPDKRAFDKHVQKLLFHDIIPNWRNLDTCEQMERVGRVARWHKVALARRSLGLYGPTFSGQVPSQDRANTVFDLIGSIRSIRSHRSN